MSDWVFVVFEVVGCGLVQWLAFTLADMGSPAVLVATTCVVGLLPLVAAFDIGINAWRDSHPPGSRE